MRIAYINSKGILSFAPLYCLCPFLSCFKKLNDINIEIALFKRAFLPHEQIQALVNLVENANKIKKITMSLYMMVEIKDSEEQN
jgi:hypothetical protein